MTTKDHVLESLAQSLRKAHCSHEFREVLDHVCIGVCTVTREGVVLDCKACGSGDELITPSDTLPETRLVRLVLNAVGVSYDAITPERKRDAVEAAKAWMGRKS